MTTPPTAAPARARNAAAIAVRTTVAAAGGYAVAQAFAAFATVVLPFERADRVTTGTLLSFLLWTGVALHAFAARTAWRATWRTTALGAALALVATAFAAAATRP
jgi:hypothetical protein